MFKLGNMMNLLLLLAMGVVHGERVKTAACSFDVFNHATHGTKHKLVVYFDGGGGLDEPATEGLFNLSHPSNPMSNHTIVHIALCSGDAHVGDRGVNNTRAVLDWIRAQQAKGGLNDPLDHLVVAGSSAGALAAQIWASNVTSAVNAREVSLVFDSYVGVFPDDSRVLKSLGACPHLPTPALRDACDQNDVRLRDITEVQIKDLIPEARVAFVQSKHDLVQNALYDRVLFTDSTASENQVISSADFYAETLRILELYDDDVRSGGDVATFFVDSDVHGYLKDDTLFYETTVGAAGDSTAGDLTLATWLSGVVPLVGRSNATQECRGRLVSEIPHDPTDTNYCGENLRNRTTSIFESDIHARHFGRMTRQAWPILPWE